MGQDQQSEGWKARIFAAMQRAFQWGEQSIPPGVRTILGLLLIVAGFFGFLPILGFWMTPVGAVLVALDVPPWRRWLRKRLDLQGAGSPGKPDPQ